MSAGERSARLSRPLALAVEQSRKLAEQLLDEGDAWHAGLVAGMVVALEGAAITADRITKILNHEAPTEVKDGIREDPKQEGLY